jgi:hypothetical protein
MELLTIETLDQRAFKYQTKLSDGLELIFIV